MQPGWTQALSFHFHAVMGGVFATNGSNICYHQLWQPWIPRVTDKNPLDLIVGLTSGDSHCHQRISLANQKYILLNSI